MFFFKQKTAYEMRISDWSFRRVLFRSILRLTVIIPTLHPQLASNAFVWRRGQSVADEHDLPHYGLQSDAYLKSPVIRIFAGEGGIRRRLEGANPPRDFPILDDLLADGATDYVAMPLRFSIGRIKVLTLPFEPPAASHHPALALGHHHLPI